MPFEYEPLEDDLTKEIFRYCKRKHVTVRVKSSGMVPNIVYPLVAQDILDFNVREDDVYLISTPRSGTTWASEMIWLLRNGMNFEKAKQVNLLERFPMLHFPYLTESPTSTDFLRRIENMESPRCIKAHLLKPHLPKEMWTKKPKIVSIFRNPKEVAISVYYLLKLYVGYSGPMELVLNAFLQDKLMFTPFWRQVLDFWELRNEKNVMFLRYDDMKNDLEGVIRRTADFLDVKFKEEEQKALLDHLGFSSMQNNKTVNQEEELKEMKRGDNFIREGRTGSWRTTMTPEMIGKFDQWIEDNLKESDFPREGLF